MEASAFFPQSWANVFYWVGVLAVAFHAFRYLFRAVHAFRVWVLGNGTMVGPHLGAWAVVTGATDGIGKAYTKELAKRGMKVVLISRSQDKLDQVASEISEKFKVETKTIAADFEDQHSIYNTIKAGLEGLEIGILVNNVGVSYSYPEYFLEIPNLDKTIDNMLNVNVLSVCKMTRLVLPSMLERSKGIIVNVSSFAAYLPMPFVSLYSATKVFVDFFSRGLNTEYKNKGIIVQTVAPYLVVTKMSKVRKSMFRPTPEEYVKHAINTIGLETQTAGCPSHAFMSWFNSVLPDWYRMRLITTTSLKSRARNLKKLKEN